MASYSYLFKTIVVGDGAVGKTSLTARFSEGHFSDQYKLTVGVSFAIKSIDVDGIKVKLQIWDTGGQERFSDLRSLYYKGAKGCLLVYDVTRRETFSHIENWFNEVVSQCRIIPMVLVANKVDLTDSRAVSREDGEQLAYSRGFPYYESSAKFGVNVIDCFSLLARMMVRKVLSE
ncbi:MAG: GTP-binding protein [Promethearchaeota archaeon]